jgi:hypothetical protein
MVTIRCHPKTRHDAVQWPPNNARIAKNLESPFCALCDPLRRLPRLGRIAEIQMIPDFSVATGAFTAIHPAR